MTPVTSLPFLPSGNDASVSVTETKPACVNVFTVFKILSDMTGEDILLLIL
jgi:hypothetical protein